MTPPTSARFPLPHWRAMMGEALESVCRFLFDRLPKPAEPFADKPCIAENWFVDDARPRAPYWITDRDLRRIWRVARLQRLGVERGGGCPWLLLHQMTDLLEFVLEAAERILLNQQPHLREAA